MATLHETDFYAWMQRQATLLRLEEFAEVDWNNLIEEIESLGRSQQNELRSRLEVLSGICSSGSSSRSINRAVGAVRSMSNVAIWIFC